MNLTLEAIENQSYYGFDPSYVDKKLLTLKPGMNVYQFGAVFKNENDNDCFFYGFNFANPSFVQAIENSPNVYKSPVFLFSTIRNQLYYAADNAVYLYDISANFSRVVYMFAPGENVSTMELQDNTDLQVATYDGSEGKLYGFKVSNTGDLVDFNYVSKYEGFGKIIKLVYKK